MRELVIWLTACLDEDERIVRTAAEEDGPDWHYDGHAVLTRRENDLVAVGSQDYMGPERGTHIAEHDPARVLRDIDAKRRMIARIRYHADLMGWDEVHGDLLRLLASVYDARPGFQESWRQ